jgi:hypothetical protein
MKRKLPKPQPKPIKSAPPKETKGGMTDEQRTALAAVTSMGGNLAGEADIGEMQALIGAARDLGTGRKKRPAGVKVGPGTRRKPGPRRRRRG